MNPDRHTLNKHDSRITALEKKAKMGFWGWTITLLPSVLLLGLFGMVYTYETQRNEQVRKFIDERIAHDIEVKTTVERLWEIWGE